MEQSFRDFVSAWLERRGWSQARLAEACDVSQSLVSKHLSRDERVRVRPSPQNLERYAPVLDVPYEDLMRMCGYLPPKGEITEADAIAADVNARTAELLAAVRGAPPAFWESMIRSTFDMATGYARNMAEFLKDSQSEQSKPRAGNETQHKASAQSQPAHTTQGRPRRKPNIKLRNDEFFLMASAATV